MSQKEGAKLQENIIEFNGKRYDAFTGELLGKGQEKVAVPLATLAQSARRNIDGIVRPGKHAAHSASKPKSHAPAHKTTGAKKPANAKPKTHRQPAKTIRPHQPENAKTLMRRAVQKPDVTKKPAIKTQTPAEVMAKPASSLIVKRSVTHVDPVRKQRASQTPKSQAVRRFNAASRAQAQAPGNASQLQPASPKPTPQPTAHHITRPTQHNPQQKVERLAASTDIFEAAIARASSHEQPAHPVRKQRKKRKLASVLAGIAALLIMGGFLAYLNMPAIELKVASVNAGFGAQMPTYSPTGYGLADIENRPGKVTLSFRSGERSYKLTQQPTNWNSQTLQDEIIASAGHKTIEAAGRIIYLYDGNASWISGDVRYDLTGNAELDESEIAAIATST